MKHYHIIICDYNQFKHLDLSYDSYYGDYHFYFESDRLYLECNNGLYFKDGSKHKELKFHRRYETVLKETFYTVSLYVLEEYSKRYTKYYYEDIMLSSHPKANIKTYDIFLNDTYTFIKNSKIVSNFKYIYVNGKRYHGTKLKNNDLIDILGLKIIYNEKFLLINDYKCHINLRIIDIKTIKYDIFKEKVINIKHKYQATINKPKLSYTIDLKDNISHETNTSFAINFFQSLLVSMGMFAIAFVNVYIGIQNNRSTIELLPIIMMPSIMAISTLCFPIINKFYQKHKINQKERNVQIHNIKIINELKSTIEQDIYLIKKYHQHFVFNKQVINDLFYDGSFFSRSEKDYDYLCLFLGYGIYHTNIKIDIKNGSNYIYNTNLINNLIKEYKRISNIEIYLDFKDYDFITIYTKKDLLLHYFELILTQLICLHSNLKIAFYIDKEIYNTISYLKDINNIFDNDKRRIYFNECDIPYADDEILLICLKELKINFNKGKYRILYFTSDDIIPKNSKVIIRLAKDSGFIEKQGYLQEFKIYDYYLNFKEIHYRLRNYHSHLKVETNKYELIDYYHKTLDLKRSYNEHRHGIELMFGIKDDGQPLIYDISDKGIGPHIVISGGTGSGKSVHVLSFILSLVTNYPANKLNITLIDYKGSGLIESLSYNDKILPHITMHLTNLDKPIFDRSIIALKKECERREGLFRELSLITKTSIMCLEDYHNAYYEECGLAYLPNHFIIIDEFAELKKDKPDFMKDIISIARIGRSLGIQLVLITQKPSSVIDQEIWANISCRIALKAQNESDSKEMLGNNLAVNIKYPGEFYLLANNNYDHAYTLNSRSFIDKKNETYVALLKPDLKIKNVVYYEAKNKQRQLDLYIKQIIDYHIMNNIKTESIYVNPLREHDSSILLKKYQYNLKDKEVLLGEYDDYLELRQNILTHDLDKIKDILVIYKDYQKRNKFINNIIESIKYRNNYPILYIHDFKTDKKYSEANVEYLLFKNEEDVIYVLKYIIKYNFDGILLIDDYETLIQNENIKDLFEQLFSTMYQMNTKIIIFLRNYNFISYKYRDNFEKYVIDILSKEELMMIYNCYNKYSEDAIFYNKQKLVGFKIANANYQLPNYAKEHVLKHIPQQIHFKHQTNMLMLGYNLESRDRFYINKNMRILFISSYIELLNKYQNISNIDSNTFSFKTYKDIDNNLLYDAIVWIGPNINNQYLFISNIKNDLKVNEAYLHIIGKRGIKLVYE